MTASAGLVVGSWPGPSFGTNPFVGEYARALEAAGCTVVDVFDPARIGERIDVLHIHWPEQLMWQGGSIARQAYRIARALRAIARLRRRGTRIVWMVHNLRPHETGGARGALWWPIEHVLPRLVDGIMTLSPATLPVVTAAMPALAGKPAAGVFHPPYPDDAPPRDEARRALGIPADGQVLAMLGFLRPYKGADVLIDAFRALPGAGRRLIVAGRCAPGYAAVLRAKAAADPRVTLEIGELDPAELARYTAAADWVVLPFRGYLHSGSMVHALSLGRPVITPSAPFARDVAGLVAEGAVRMYEGELTTQILAGLPPRPPRPDLSALTPERLGLAARAFYTSLANDASAVRQ